MIELPPRMVIFISKVKIYEANLIPLRVEIDDNVVYELTRERIDNWRKSDGDELWKAALAKLVYK